MTKIRRQIQKTLKNKHARFALAIAIYMRWACFYCLFMGRLIPYIVHLDKQLIMLLSITYNTFNFDNLSLKSTSLVLNCKI